MVEDEGSRPGHVLVRGISNCDTYIPLDAVVKVAEGKAFVNVPELVVAKMPWDEPPAPEEQQEKVGPRRAQVERLYGSVVPTAN